MFLSLAVALALSVVGCAPATPSRTPSEAGGGGASPTGDQRQEDVEPQERASEATPSATRRSTEPAEESASTASVDEVSEVSKPANGRSLPRLTLRSVGLHIGGGVTDETVRNRYKDLLEAHHPMLKQCYVHIKHPRRGGLYGLDMLVKASGGPPLIRDVRTALGGDEFKRCVRRAFERLEFPAPEGGSQVVSYSVRFSLKGLQ